jgi:starch synthase (maltosyl-transferring)
MAIGAMELPNDGLRRVAIERVRPEVDCGRFPIKRSIGERIIVSADIHADGHDVLAGVLLFRKAGASGWHEVPMLPVDNDRWEARFTVEELGRYEYCVEGWIDRFDTWRHEIEKKFAAGQAVSNELIEGATIVREAARRAGERLTADATDAKSLEELAAALEDARTEEAERVSVGLSDELADLMATRTGRDRTTRYDRVLEVVVERERARFGAWYEMFPRSAGVDPSRSATFAEAAERLRYVADLGFDVLYLPPIHPIGHSFRKGPNNTLEAGPKDPGSPWAIGNETGGHMAIEPGLGSIDDFDRFVTTARTLGLEIALDLAYQVSPDHPYVAEHPEWFSRRPDGSIKYAENPPKKYQDIYPFNFESEDWQALWTELKRIVEFWIDHGVTIFRVDNPHTKPYAFWQWALADLKRQHPETIFLSEAFTRPKVMKFLAKSGFSQSYTYFTWRNTKAELTEYFTELTQTDVREYLRPNLFTNTPDILHAYLQRGGRPAFDVRLILAATLGANYGIYSGFELAEHVPLRDGSEEYFDSEKYQIRVRHFDQAGALAALIARVNEIRREHPALQRDWGLRFHDTDNPNLICYSKRSEDGADLVVVVVNLDPGSMEHGFVRLPLPAWGMASSASFEVVDLLSSERYLWRGESNYVRLDPPGRMGHILHVQLLKPLPEEPSNTY